MNAEMDSRNANINFYYCIMDFFRNVLLRPFKSSTCRVICRRIRHTGTLPTHSSFIDFQLLDLEKFLVWLELMELESPQRSRFLQESRSQI